MFLSSAACITMLGCWAVICKRKRYGCRGWNQILWADCLPHLCLLCFCFARFQLQGSGVTDLPPFAAFFSNQRYVLLLTGLCFLPCRCTVETEGASYPISYLQPAFPHWRDKYHRGLRDGGRNRLCQCSCYGQCELKLCSYGQRLSDGDKYSVKSTICAGKKMFFLCPLIPFRRCVQSPTV